jgi:hypothetical protein
MGIRIPYYIRFDGAMAIEFKERRAMPSSPSEVG